MLGYHPFFFWSLAALAAFGTVEISRIHKQFVWPYVVWAVFNLVIAYVLFMT